MLNIDRIVAYYTLVDMGLEDQRAAVETFSSVNGAEIVGQYVEKPSKQKHSWSKLAEAIGQAKATGSWLVIAKLGRLEFNVTVTQLLESSQVNFVCLDKEGVWQGTIRAVAEHARDKVRLASQRKRDTFSTQRANGAKLAPGLVNYWKTHDRRRVWEKGTKNSAKARTARANQAYALLIPKMRELRATMSYVRIAEELNSLGHQTTAGMPFNGPTVCRILQRAEKAERGVKDAT
jgi:hypothetical protein